MSRAFKSNVHTWLAAALLVACTVGCTPFTNFYACCSQAACRYAGWDDLSGCWDGSWCSHKNGHHGRLRGIITRCDDTHYHARFHARFWKFFTYEYEVTLNAVRDGDVWRLSGSKDLGKIAGVFHYSGWATTTQFHCNYRSCTDCGLFQMEKQPCCGTSCCP